MANFQFNIAKGAIKTMMANVGTSNARLIVVPIAASGIDTDATMMDLDTLDDVLTGSDEQEDMGRKTLTSSDLSITVNDSDNRLDIDMTTDITWEAATGAEVAKLVFAYDSDTESGTDANIVPLLAYDFSVTPSGIDIIARAHANGLIRIS